MDNFYSSPTLFKHLKSEGFEACGTIEVTRRDFPDNLRPHKKALAKAKVERGEGRWMRDGDLVFVMWRHTKVVLLSLPCTLQLEMTLWNGRSKTKTDT